MPSRFPFTPFPSPSPRGDALATAARGVSRRALLRAGAAAGLAPLLAGRVIAAPPREVQAIDLDWTDAARQRPVPARLYMPAGMAAGERLPLVVFSHGLGGSRFGYSHLGRHWAANGFASLHLQHIGSDREVWTSGFFSLITNLTAAASEANAIARAVDVSFGISSLLTDPQWATRIDASRIALAGHSYGANTALLVAGARVQREVDGMPQVRTFTDARVKVAILMSAPPFYREGDMRSILAGIAIPTLHVTGTEDVIRVPGYRSEASDRIAVFDAMPAAAGKSLAVFKGGTHSIFTDRIDAAGPELNRVVKEATRELSLAFLHGTLGGGSMAEVGEWMSRRADLLARREWQKPA